MKPMSREWTLIPSLGHNGTADGLIQNKHLCEEHVHFYPEDEGSMNFRNENNNVHINTN
jgi:hypothetical protein